MTGMLLNVGHLQAHKNISQGRKRDSRRHSTAGFSEKVVHVVAKGGYQFLELFSFCRRERAYPPPPPLASIKITVLTFLLKKDTMKLSSGVSAFFFRIREKTLSYISSSNVKVSIEYILCLPS